MYIKRNTENFAVVKDKQTFKDSGNELLSRKNYYTINDEYR